LNYFIIILYVYLTLTNSYSPSFYNTQITYEKLGRLQLDCLSSLKRDDVSSEPSYLSASKSVSVIDVPNNLHFACDGRQRTFKKNISQESILLDIFEVLIQSIQYWTIFSHWWLHHVIQGVIEWPDKWNNRWYNQYLNYFVYIQHLQTLAYNIHFFNFLILKINKIIILLRRVKSTEEELNISVNT